METTPTVAFAVDTFGDVTRDEAGQELHHAQVIRNVVEEAVLAERVGPTAGRRSSWAAGRPPSRSRSSATT